MNAIAPIWAQRSGPRVYHVSKLTARQAFHSQEHPELRAATRTLGASALLEAAYAHVPQLGFTPQALAAGAREVGQLDISCSLLNDGPSRLIQYHLELCRRQLYTYSKQHLSQRDSIDVRVETLLWHRLLANQNVIHHWQQVCLRSTLQASSSFTSDIPSTCRRRWL